MELLVEEMHRVFSEEVRTKNLTYQAVSKLQMTTQDRKALIYLIGLTDLRKKSPQ